VIRGYWRVNDGGVVKCDIGAALGGGVVDAPHGGHETGPLALEGGSEDPKE